MSNQIVISSGAKVRELEGVLTGTSGVVNSLAINVPNGIPQLDGSGKILVSQLPNSVMEYKGSWNAATNTPTLVNGTGNAGDVYLCEVAGTVNFGAGPIAFFVGDQVVYSGTIWQRASGSTGTVTSVSVTESGDALTITGSPITTSGTINIGFTGTSGQYVNGAGGLTTFPTDNITGSGASGQVTYFNGTNTITGENAFNYDASTNRLGVNTTVPNATIGANAGIDSGYSLLLKNDNANYNGIGFATDSTYGNLIATEKLGTATTRNLTLLNQSGYISLTEAGNLGVGILNPNTGIDIYNGTTSSLWLHTANSGITGTDGVRLALFSNNGANLRNFEGAMSITSEGDFSVITLGAENFKINSADGSIYQSKVANAMLKSVSGVITAAVAGTDYLAPASISGTTNTLAKFTSSSAIGNSNITDTGSLISLGSTTNISSGNLGVGTSSPAVSGVGIDIYSATTAGLRLHNAASGTTVSDGAGINFSAANNLGITNYEAGAIDIVTNGNSGVYIASNGFVGINGATPSTALTVTGSITQSSVTSALLKANGSGLILAAVAGTDYVAPSALSGYVPTSRTITINGNTQNLTTDSSYSVGTLTGNGTSGRIPFYSGTTTLSNSENLTWDNTNGYLGVNNTPEVPLDVTGFGFNVSGTNMNIVSRFLRDNSATFKGIGLGYDTTSQTGIIYADTASSASNIAFWTFNGSSYAEKMRITGSGNVGIGTSSPTTFSGNTTLSINNAAGGAVLELQSNGTSAFRMATSSGDSALWEPRNVPVLFATNNSERMRITSGGNVGIGTSSPIFSGFAQLTVNGTQGGIAIQASSTGYSRLFFAKDDTSNVEGLIRYYHSDNSMQFFTSATERMRITSGGNVGIGTSSPGVSLDVAGRIRNTFNSSGTTVFESYNTSSTGYGAYISGGVGVNYALQVADYANNIRLTIRGDGLVAFPTINNFTTGNSPNTWINPNASYGIYINTSSIRYKKDIFNYDKGLDIVNQLRPVYYKGISEVDGDKQFAGFIAEEIHDLGLTEFVNYLEDGRPNSLSYPNMMTLAVKAIQELSSELNELKALIAAK